MKYNNSGMDVQLDLEDLINSLYKSIKADTDPGTFQYYKNLEKRRILLNDSIDDNTFENVILPLEEMDNDGTGKPIEILLQTCGGDVFNGFQLVHTIEHLKTPTTIRIYARALSMGIHIAMAGFNNPNVKVVCNKYSIGLIHSGSIGYGIMEANAAKDLSRFNERYDDTIIKEFVLSHSKITKEKFEEIKRQEYYMTADEMLELGIIDDII